MRILLPFALATVLLLNACSMPKLRLPTVYKQTVQQGNVLNQEMIDQLRPGMTRNQVSFIMGEPVYRNSFDDDRWDYVYTIEVPGLFTQQQLVSLFFVDEELAFFTGDVAPSRYIVQPAEPASGTAEAEDPASGDSASDTATPQAASG